jgi:hypothetical protein
MEIFIEFVLLLTLNVDEACKQSGTLRLPVTMITAKERQDYLEPIPIFARLNASEDIHKEVEAGVT